MEQVKVYDGFGDHQTGTEADRQTARWFTAQLREMGASVLEQCFSFRRFDGKASLCANGAPIAALPLYSAGTGDLVSDRIKVMSLDINLWDDTQDWQEAVASACGGMRRDGFDALAVATRSASGELIALNCSSVPKFDVPIVLVSGRNFESLQYKAELVFSARRVEAQSANIIGHLGGPSAAGEIIITTPLTGWFGCAGERGTGIAILLELTRELAEKRPVTIIGTTGHELAHLGGELAAASYDGKASKVIHLGSCLGSFAQTNRQPAQNGPSFRTILLANDEKAGRIEQFLQARGLSCRRAVPARDPNSWQGETRLWVSKTDEMISLAGVSDLFHTVLDKPERVTSPALLEGTLNAIRAMLLQFIED